MYYVYLITNILNGKKYVGKTNNPAGRWAGHKNLAQTNATNQAIHSAIRKYGSDSFLFDVLVSYESEKDAYAHEMNVICELKTLAPSGYNLNAGGKGGLSGFKHTESTKRKIGEKSLGRTHSDKAKLKMSKKRKGKPTWNKGKTNIYSKETLEKIAAGHRGVPLSLEQRAKLSKSLSGREITDEHRIKISAGLKGRTFSKKHKENLVKAWKRRREQND